MTTTSVEMDPEIYEEFEDEAAYQPYRALSKSALISFVLAILSTVALVFPVLLVLPLVGLLLGIAAKRKIHRYPDELTGRWLAWLGIAGCALLLVGGSAMHTYIYATEVPDGFTRITFADLQPAGSIPATGEPRLPFELDGQRIFVKGYVHPGVSSTGKIKKFILVPDMGTCCFGGQPKLTDMIEVTLGDLPGIRYNTRKRKLAGVLHVYPRVHKVAGGLQGGYYELAAEFVK